MIPTTANDLNLSEHVNLDREFGVLDRPPYRELSWEDIGKALDTTIKDDFETKVITFIACLLAQTEEDQFNISFQSESASGKSYIALNVVEFFPPEEVIEIAHASATAFFHEFGEFDKATHEKIIDLENKILVFLDLPDYRLLANLRPLLSHDKKELHVRITDKTQAFGLATKHILLKGFCTVIFCTTYLNPDEQERTRLLFLSPSTSKEKLKKSIQLLSSKQSDPHNYRRKLEENSERNWLKRLVGAVRASGIKEVKIQDDIDVSDQFISKHPELRPKDQRDFMRVLSLIKGHALVNFRNRERDEFGALIANQKDVQKGFELYDKVSDANNLGISPYTLKIFNDAIGPFLTAGGMRIRDFREHYFRVFNRSMNDRQVRSLLQELEDAGLIGTRLEGREKWLDPPYVADISDQKGNKPEQGIYRQRQGGDGKDNQAQLAGTLATAQSPTSGDRDPTDRPPPDQSEPDRSQEDPSV